MSVRLFFRMLAPTADSTRQPCASSDVYEPAVHIHMGSTSPKFLQGVGGVKPSPKVSTATGVLTPIERSGAPSPVSIVTASVI